MNLVTLRDVSVAYDGYEALQHVDLEIARRRFPGCHRSQRRRKNDAREGHPGNRAPHRRADVSPRSCSAGKERLIGYMPQISDFDRAFPISVLEVVLSGLQGRRGFSSRYTKEDRARAMELLAASGIADTARSPIGEVSGGQMQRALLARAVISDPKLLILDEPANFVDNKFEKELYRTLHELNARMAIVMVSHDIGTITSVVKEIVCVNRPRAPPPFEHSSPRSSCATTTARFSSYRTGTSPTPCWNTTPATAAATTNKTNGAPRMRRSVVFQRKGLPYFCSLILLNFSKSLPKTSSISARRAA